MASKPVSEPVPIHLVAGKYLVYDADTASHLRSAHNITGVLIGGLSQAPQQNVFLGLPVELMPEEARLLVEKKIAYLVDDASQHVAAFMGNGVGAEDKAQFERLLSRQSADAAEAQTRRAEERKDNALRKLEEEDEKKVGNGDMDNWNDMPEGMLAPRPKGAPRQKSRRRGAERSVSGTVTPLSAPPSSASPSGPPSRSRTPVRTSAGDDEEPPSDQIQELSLKTDEDQESLFSTTTTPASSTAKSHISITPATSYPPLRPAQPHNPIALPEVPTSYPLFKYLHSKGYFLSPGLRFGCRYVAYPGDPLRFHSHFLVEGKGWDEEFSLMDVVSGGRLGTGVKKGFLLGGQDGDAVRAFTVEWAGM